MTAPKLAELTDDDLAGRSQARKDAYNERRRDLAAHGIHIADLYDDDQLDDDPDGSGRFHRRQAASAAATAAYDRETQRLVELAEADARASRASSRSDGWLTRGTEPR